LTGAAGGFFAGVLLAVARLAPVSAGLAALVGAAAFGAEAADSAGAPAAGAGAWPVVLSARAPLSVDVAPVVTALSERVAEPSRRSPPQAASSTTAVSVADRVLVIVVLSQGYTAVLGRSLPDPAKSSRYGGDPVTVVTS
jgi:hypothetical protein